MTPSNFSVTCEDNPECSGSFKTYDCNLIDQCCEADKLVTIEPCTTTRPLQREGRVQIPGIEN